MTFSAEVRIATEYLLNQIYGTRYGNERALHIAWCNFWFFSEIRPSEVHKLRRLTPQDDMNAWGLEQDDMNAWGWELSREVQFFVRGVLVAEIELVGVKFDHHPEYNARPMWAIVHVRYAERLDHVEPTHWHDRTFEFAGYVMAE
jgi:hypothetical protein